MPNIIRAAANRLIEFGNQMVADGMVVGPAGNLSVRVGELVAITPSQVPYDRLRAESICLLRPDGSQIDGTGAPSSETPMHLLIYARTDAAAVVHTHSRHAVAASTVLDAIPALHYGVLRASGRSCVPVAPYACYGTLELAEITVDTLGEGSAVILQNHGVLTVGRDLDEAYERAQLVEWLAEVYLSAARLGKPRALSAAELMQVARRQSLRSVSL